MLKFLNRYNPLKIGPLRITYFNLFIEVKKKVSWTKKNLSNISKKLYINLKN